VRLGVVFAGGVPVFAGLAFEVLPHPEPLSFARTSPPNPLSSQERGNIDSGWEADDGGEEADTVEQHLRGGH